MNTVLFYSLYIVIDLFGTYIILCYMRLFNSYLIKNKTAELVSYVALFIVNFILTIIISEPVKLMTCNTLLLFVISFNYGSSIRQKVFSVASIMIIATTIEAIMVTAFRGSLDAVIIDIHLVMCSKIAQLGVWLILSHYFDSTIKSKKSYIQWYFPVLFSLVMLIIELMMQQEHFDATQIILSIALMFSMIISLIYIYKLDQERLKTEKLLAEQKADNFSKQYKQLHESFDSFNSMRHNLAKHFIKLDKMITEDYGESERIKRYLDEILMETIGTEKHLVETDNIEIDSIINAKSREAADMGIKINHKILIPEHMDIDKDVFSMVLNKVFDAALIEADIRKNTKLNFIMRYDAEYVYIFWVYPCIGNGQDIKKVLLKKYKSMINEIREAIRPFHGRMYCEVDEGRIIWDVFMYAGEL